METWASSAIAATLAFFAITYFVFWAANGSGNPPDLSLEFVLGALLVWPIMLLFVILDGLGSISVVAIPIIAAGVFIYQTPDPALTLKMIAVLCACSPVAWSVAIFFRWLGQRTTNHDVEEFLY